MPVATQDAPPAGQDTSWCHQDAPVSGAGYRKHSPGALCHHATNHQSSPWCHYDGGIENQRLM